MDRSRLLAWPVELRIAVKEDKRQHAQAYIIYIILPSNCHLLFDGIQDFCVSGKVMENGDAFGETSNWAERGYYSLGDFMLLSQEFKSLPVKQVTEGNEVMDSSWRRHV